MKIKHTISNVCLVLKYYMKYVPGYMVGQTLFTIFVSAVWAVQGPVTTKFVLDALVTGKPITEIIIFLCIVILFVLIRHSLACYIVEYLETVSNIKIRGKILNELHGKASKMDLEYYETPQFYTDYVWAAQQATWQFAKIHAYFSTLVSRVFEVLFMGSVIIALNPVMLVLAAVMGIIRFIQQRKQIQLRYAANMEVKPLERERDYSKRVFYLSDYAKEIRLSDIHEVLYERFKTSNDKICAIWKSVGRKRFKVSVLGDTGAETVGIFGIYSFLAYEILVKENLTLGDFSALSQAAMRFANRFSAVLSTALDLEEQSLYVDKFRRFMEYEPKIERMSGNMPTHEMQTLELRNVSFTYNGEKQPSLKNINMVIKPHEKIAIVGYNGAGKTTLIKLLMRLYDPTEGEILFGGKNVKEYDTESYRKEFAAVFQDYQIFAATLGENVVMDNVETGGSEEAEIMSALVQGDFGDKLNELSMGIYTPLTKEFEKSGVNLSGGEAQKVAIARAFYKPAQFAVLDEPSSALDPIAEYKLNHNMVEIAKEKTVIFISHRLSTTVMADKIYMFEKGEIIEQGTHRELMELGGKYAEMFIKQSNSYLNP